MIIFPRQAREKHREGTQKESGVFLQDATDYKEGDPIEVWDESTQSWRMGKVEFVGPDEVEVEHGRDGKKMWLDLGAMAEQEQEQEQKTGGSAGSPSATSLPPPVHAVDTSGEEQEREGEEQEGVGTPKTPTVKEAWNTLLYPGRIEATKRTSALIALANKIAPEQEESSRKRTASLPSHGFRGTEKVHFHG